MEKVLEQLYKLELYPYSKFQTTIEDIHFCHSYLAPFRDSRHLQECFSSLTLTGYWRKSVSRRYSSFSSVNIAVDVVSILFIRIYVNAKRLFLKNVNASICYFQIIHYNKGKGGK